MTKDDYEFDFSGFEDFAEADLLDLVEGTMDPDRARAFAESVKSKDPELLRRLIRMQGDRLDLSSHGDPLPPMDLLEGVQARMIRHDLLAGDFLETMEPTAMMARSVEDLDRRRGRRLLQRSVLGSLAASIALVGTVVLVFGWLLRVEDDRVVDRIQTSAQIDVDSLLAVESTGKPVNVFTALPDSSVLGVHRLRVQALNTPPVEPIQEIVVADYGLVLGGVDEKMIQPALEALSREADLVLVQNLTIAESVSNVSSFGQATLNKDPKGESWNGANRDLQPSPLVGQAGLAPETRVRLDLAERGFQWAIVVDRANAAEMVEQIGRLGRTASLVSANTEAGEFSQDANAWNAWQVRKVATPSGIGNARRLIVPIAVTE